MKTAILTTIALLAFAGNSILCRLALKEGLIDAAGFTSIRLLSGALMLMICLAVKNKQLPQYSEFKPSIRQFFGATMLFVYALCFSVAYLKLDTGSGALILFGFVQLTLLISSCLFEQRPKTQEVLGMLVAFSGLIYWLIPAWGTPSLLGFVLMAVAGVAWGMYTLVGRKSERPLLETSKNFMYCIPWVLLLNLIIFQPKYWTYEGIILAVISGAVTSGVGYAIWYAALPKLTSMKAAVLQLLVPIIAALGGWILVAEPISSRWLVSAALVLGGVFWVIKRNNKTNEL